MRILAGMIVSLVGVLLIILSPVFFDGKNFVLGEIEGNLYILIATLGMVFQTIIGKDLLKKINPYFVAFSSFFTSSLLFLIFVPSELSKWSFSNLNINGWIGIVYGVFFSSALAYFLYYYGIGKIYAQEVGIFSYIDPIVALLIAVPLLHEYPTLHYLLGSFLVFGGIYLAEKRIHYHPIHKIKSRRDPVEMYNVKREIPKGSRWDVKN